MYIYHIEDDLLLQISEEYEMKIQEYTYYFTYFSPSSHLTLVFLSYRPFVVNTTFSTGLEMSSVSWLGQERNTKVLNGTTVKIR